MAHASADIVPRDTVLLSTPAAVPAQPASCAGAAPLMTNPLFSLAEINEDAAAADDTALAVSPPLLQSAQRPQRDRRDHWQHSLLYAGFAHGVSRGSVLRLQ